MPVQLTTGQENRAGVWESRWVDDTLAWSVLIHFSLLASPPSITSDYTTGNHIRLALAAVIMFIAGAFLLEAWCRQRRVGGESGKSETVRNTSFHGLLS